MRIEKAIKLLEETGLDCMYEEETQEALWMAIDALKKKPIPIEWIKNRIKEIKHAHEVCGVKNNDAITILESMLYEWDKQNRGEE